MKAIQDQRNAILAQAEAKCSKAGLRFTGKRQRLLDLLAASGKPMSAYDLVDRYKEEFDTSLPAMSVYRMLGFLMDAGLVHKLETLNQYVICSHITCSHQHEVPQFLICDECHDVAEVGLRAPVLNELKHSIESTGFAIKNQQIELHGLCTSCRNP